MYILARKNYLAINLMKMCRVFDKEYKIAPPTWLLPSDWTIFTEQFNKKRAKTFIVKPEAS
jgi:tubulin polyglutamylase TTLL6/13